MDFVELERRRRRMVLRFLRLGKEEEGAVMVEFIIVAPLFLFVVLGILQLMGVAHTSAILQYANYRALRTGIVHYEPIMQGWGPYARMDPTQREALLIERMQLSAEQSLGPIYQPLAGYEDLARAADRPIRHAPTPVLDVRMDVGVIEVVESSPNLPHWLTSQLHVDVGMPYPFVGRAIETLHLGLSNLETPGDFASRGFHPAARTADAPADRPNRAMAWITLSSDSRLDTRKSFADEYWLSWPFTDGEASPVGNPSLENITFDPRRRLPATLPVQTRLRYSPDPHLEN